MHKIGRSIIDMDAVEDEVGAFLRIRRIDHSRLAEIFAREVLPDLVRKELLSPEWAGTFAFLASHRLQDPQPAEPKN